MENLGKIVIESFIKDHKSDSKIIDIDFILKFRLFSTRYNSHYITIEKNFVIGLKINRGRIFRVGSLNLCLGNSTIQYIINCNEDEFGGLEEGDSRFAFKRILMKF